MHTMHTHMHAIALLRLNQSLLLRHSVGVRTFADASERGGVGEVARIEVGHGRHFVDIVRSKGESERVSRTDVKDVLVADTIHPPHCRRLGIGTGADDDVHRADLLRGHNMDAGHNGAEE